MSTSAIRRDIHDGAIAVPAGPVPFPLVPERTALLVIDMQKDFCVPGGHFTVAALREPIPRIAAVLDAVRGTDILVVYTRYGKRPDLSDVPPLTIGRFVAATEAGVEGGTIYGDDGPLGRICVRGEPGWEIIDELQPREGEPIVEKATMGSFRFTDLELILRNQGRDRLLITGITTDVCVMSTMREGHDLGFGCCLLTDCAAAPDAEIHRGQVDQLAMHGGVFGWWSTSDALLEALDDAEVPRTRDVGPPKDPGAYW